MKQKTLDTEPVSRFMVMALLVAYLMTCGKISMGCTTGAKFQRAVYGKRITGCESYVKKPGKFRN